MRVINKLTIYIVDVTNSIESVISRTDTSVCFTTSNTKSYKRHELA